VSAGVPLPLEPLCLTTAVTLSMGNRVAGREHVERVKGAG
jgi:hypothetical protein